MEMKERILQKANDLFRRYGFKSITMDEIATQLGASKKTIYQYFSDKDELVEAVVKQTIDYAQQTCENNRVNSKDAVHELIQAMDFVQQIFSGMNPAMMYDLERFHPQSYKLFLDHKTKYLYDIIRLNLKRGIAEELYRPEINIDVIAKFRLEGMMIAFNQDVYPASKFNLGDLHTAIIEHFLFGVASLKGYKLILKYQQERIKS
jgi:TetR/AcrR family transcriptional regulator, cholesterol catabolism regulator